MSTQELATAVKNTGSRFIDSLSAFSEADMNKTPYEGSWTGGQVAEHIVKANGVELLFVPGTPSDRDPAQHVQAIRDIFLNFDAKYKAPERLTPQDGFHAKEPLLNTLHHQWSKLENAVQTQDLSEMCGSFEFPGIGKLTKLEVVNLIESHTQRHLRQLNKIHEAIG
ncbi:DinB family protein [Taibaiella soli]|uniref:DinB family protein n=1 Tax=Taibaiella soli TaxID=1649169 RepID=A0A2W2BD06_9BACT|nr:DinB family protein [Taibaiella soli]PZF74129.1 DinB family protein [Taibaiella soli]